MKKIECIMRPERLQVALDALLLAGVPGVTVTEVRGFGKQRVHPDPLLKPKAKIEIYLEDEEVDTIVQALVIAVRAGQMGDGKIAVLNVEDLVRVRTQERDRRALY